LGRAGRSSADFSLDQLRFAPFNAGMRALLLACLLFIFTPASRGELVNQRPNIILILTDDQGYGDISAHGNPILKTPNLDRLHGESARFTDFHVSPTCAPTRSALLTGRHEFRNGVTHTIHERERLSLDSITLAQVLQRAGYKTGIFGKWHLGDEPAYWPSARGFDEMFIHGAGGIGQTYPGSCGDAPGNTYFDPAILHNGQFVKTKGYCTDVFFAEAAKWIDNVKGKQPFYCHLATNAPHAPLQVRPEDEALYAGKVPADTAKYFGMIANIDRNVGELLDRLAAWGIERDTLVIFITDNGGTAGTAVYNGGARGKKVTPWLGGTHACSFWRLPGKIPAGDRAQLAAHLDFFPTIAELAGATLTDAERQQVEGRSLIPVLAAADAPWPERTLFTHVGRWELGSDPETGKYMNCSVRTPRWTLVSVPSKPRAEIARPSWQLFDVKADYAQSHNVAAEHPEVVAELAAAYERWWSEVRPRMVNERVKGPAVNPFKELYWKQFGR
jgi:arylsulfatase